jgi:uncharacterized protein (DUF849 family)
VHVLIELIDLSPEQAGSQAHAIHGALDQGDVTAPRLQHGEGEATWPTFREALERGLDVRIGLEATLEHPDGRVANGNVDLISAAIEMIMQLSR